MDPLSPDYPMLTPYQFAANKPIWAIDLDGLEPWETNNGPINGPYANQEQASAAAYEKECGLPETSREYSVTDPSTEWGKTISRGTDSKDPYSYSYNGNEYINGDTRQLNNYLTDVFINNQSFILNRFMVHWKVGGGTDYILSQYEFDNLGLDDINPRRVVKFEDYNEMRAGQSKPLLKIVHISSNQSGIMGTASIVFRGTLTMGEGQNWSYSGEMTLFDTYDFDMHELDISKSLEYNINKIDRNIVTGLGGIANNVGNVFYWSIKQPFKITKSDGINFRSIPGSTVD